MDHVDPDSSAVTSTSASRSQRYSDEFKRDAVRLITEEKYKFTAAAHAVGVSEKSLRDWHRKFAPPPAACDDDASLDELREENKRLRKQLKRAELEREILKKATAYFAKESQCPFVDKQGAWIKEHRGLFPVAVMCGVLRVSTSGYYDSLDRPPSKRALRHERIKQSVACAHAESSGIYGSLKVADQLKKRDDMETACRNTVAAAMREMGLKSKVRKAFKPTTTQADPTKQPAANTLDRNFTAATPNRKWVTDITYLPTAQGWVYLAVVLDLFSRKVVGWSIGDSLATPLVSDALRQAIESRRPDGKRLLHHSDRGCQYTSDAYQRTLQTLGITCSMSRRGDCYDNAMMERFFWSLKHEWTKHDHFVDLQDARLSVFKYIETFYNPVRVHQTLGYLSPDQFEAENAPALAA
jgi:putative transposase